MEEKTFEEKCELVLREAFYETPIFYEYLKEIIGKAIQVQAKVMPNEVLVGGNDLATEVKQDIENRILKGVQTYGERLKTQNGRIALQDAYEEILDLALYIKQELKERESQREA